ncbi:ubiquinone biosynthesis monooxygenase coq6, mitochondrial [Plakobranchus ocellatus]|uniref:Ubiquinone biosynthesis monooxygenase COQ6, mitochondrial n=1 Tax=Plakobranchus ocellatus TaxID=259542 RepID=A0AAV3YM05_9GAST|nr:ubiquinone biosynthesis monooxygenase coq6, mitochondrial [Plakobranchus ocellatus]
MALRAAATGARRVLSQSILSSLLKGKYSFYSTASLQDGDFADIVISGGGMVGAGMACALANNALLRDKKIVLLEAGKDSGDFTVPDQFSNRTCALNPSTVRLLSSFGAWSEIEGMRCFPVLRMQVWESCADAMITFNNPDMSEPLAYVVENDIILASIMCALKNVKDQVEIRYESKAVEFNLPGTDKSEEAKLPFVKLTLNDGSVLKTKFLIGADGMNSAVRNASGFHTLKRQYGQSGVVATLMLGEGLSNTTAWQRFLPTGPIALLPISDTMSSLVWSTTPEHARNLQELSNESFVDAVNDALWHEREKNEVAGKLLNGFKSVLNNILPADTEGMRQLPPTVIDVVEKSRAAFPLTLIHSSQYVRPRIALIGDAAHRIHPLAGQGVNLGFSDVACLNDTLTKAVSCGADPGALTHLLQYETERQRQNIPVMLTIDGLQRLYGTEFTPVVIARSLGLHAVHSMPFLKKMIMERASA